MRELSLLVLVVFLTACPPPLPPPPDGSNCTSACQRLRDIAQQDPSCTTTTPKGEPCEAWFCEPGKDHEDWSCVVHATSCDQAKACRAQ